MPARKPPCRLVHRAKRDPHPDPVRRSPSVGLDHPGQNRNKQQCREMGSREEVNRTGANRHQRRHQSHEGVCALPHHVSEQHAGECRDENTGKPNHRLEPAHAMQGGKPDIREPLPGEPRLSGFRERVRIRIRNLAGLQNRLARADVPAGIAVGQQADPAMRPGNKSPDHQGEDESIRERGLPPVAAHRGRRRPRGPRRRSHCIGKGCEIDRWTAAGGLGWILVGNWILIVHRSTKVLLGSFVRIPVFL